MILADTSVWIDHLGRGDPTLAALLARQQIVMHSYVLGEIALGNLRRRVPVMADLRALPQAPIAAPDELIAFVERHAMFGLGIGYVDAHLLAATLLAPGMRLWTRDRRLDEAAEMLDISFRPAAQGAGLS